MAQNGFSHPRSAARPIEGDLALLALPRLTLVVLTEEARARGLTVAQFIGHALSEYLENHPVKEKGDGISK